MKSKNAALAQANLKRLGIRKPSKPGSGMPKLPARIGELTPGQVTQQMNRWAQWLSYIKVQLALAETRLVEAKNHFRMQFDIEYLRMLDLNAGKKIVVKNLERGIRTSDRFKKMQELVDLREAKFKLLAAVHDAADQSHKTLSRELTRRTDIHAGRGIET